MKTQNKTAGKTSDLTQVATESVKQVIPNKPREEGWGLIINKPLAEIKELTGLREVRQEDCIRMYYTGFGFCLQIRTFKPTTYSGVGKNKKMMASVEVGLEELKALIKYAEKKQKGEN